MSRPSKGLAVFALTLGVGACSANRDVLAAPQPQSLSGYLAANHPSDIRITDRRGHTHWFHHPVVDGDTLRGVRNHDLPQPRLALAIADVGRVEEPHFSALKTVGFFAAFTAVIAAAVALTVGSIHATY